MINIAKTELEQKREKVRKSSKIKEEEKEGTSLLEKERSQSLIFFVQENTSPLQTYENWNIS